jgi:hypothetical protein
LAVVFILSLPVSVSASVLINEIAWMGSLESSTNEWIELVNTGGTSVEVSDFTLVAEDGTPSVTLSGSIAPLSYYLIERTDDETVPGIAADLVASFGSGISNGGETLRLKDASGNVVDTLVGGVNWVNVGGDNVTKETAQQSGSGWITASATPRAPNKTVSNGGRETPAPSVATTSTSSGASENVISPSSSVGGAPWKAPPSKYPRANITLYTGGDRYVFVGFPTEFTGYALGLYDESLPYATYRWNWGDGSVGMGGTTTHTYMHAGEYVVTFEAINSQLHNLMRLNVVAAAPEITIDKVIRGERGAIFLQNTSSRDIDLSRWILSEEGGGTFVIPEHSLLRSGKTIVLGNEITALARLSGGKIVLAYPNGTQAGASEPLPVPINGSSTSVVQKSILLKATSPQKNQKVSVVSESAQVRLSDASSTAPAAATVLWDGGKKDGLNTPVSSGSTKWWMLLVGGVLLCLIGLVALRGGSESALAKEYAIIEEIDDGKEDL